MIKCDLKLKSKKIYIFWTSKHSKNLKILQIIENNQDIRFLAI